MLDLGFGFQFRVAERHVRLKVGTVESVLMGTRVFALPSAAGDAASCKEARFDRAGSGNGEHAWAIASAAVVGLGALGSISWSVPTTTMAVSVDGARSHVASSLCAHDTTPSLRRGIFGEGSCVDQLADGSLMISTVSGGETPHC